MRARARSQDLDIARAVDLRGYVKRLAHDALARLPACQHEGCAAASN